MGKEKKKKKIFKKAHLRELLEKIIFSIFLFKYKKYKDNDKKLYLNSNIQNKKEKNILIVSLDALGDNVIKLEAIKKIAKYAGSPKNITILCEEKWESLYQGYGYNVFTENNKRNIFKRALMYRKINSFDYDIVIHYDFSNKLESEEYIFSKNGIEKLNCLDKVDYILDKNCVILKKLTGKDYTWDEVRPNIKNFKNILLEKIEISKEKELLPIAVGIGAATSLKMMSPIKIIEIVNFLSNRYPKRELLLLGTGKRQKKYVDDIIENIKNTNIKNFVDKTTLEESIQLLDMSYFFIGFDSGLGNIAFCLRKKIISLFWQNSFKLWMHDKFADAKVIYGDEKNPINDGINGNDIVNSITIDQVKKALDDLKL